MSQSTEQLKRSSQSNLAKRWVCTVLLLLLVPASTGWAQAEPMPATEPAQSIDSAQATSLGSLTLEQVQDKYNLATEQLRSSLKTITGSSLSFQATGSEESEHWREQWQAAVDASKQEIAELTAAAMELFQRQDKPSHDVVDVALRQSLIHVDEGQLEKALAILKRANQISPTDQSQAFMANIQLQTNEFAEAAKYFDAHPDALKNSPDELKSLHASLNQLNKKFAREKQLRQQEADDDLPRVELITNVGKIVLELYENEAPDTVGNFIYLVEQGYYNGVIFHRVRANFMAQAGGFGVMRPDPNAQPRVLPRGVAYRIVDEHHSSKSRHHFRGSISMANQNVRNSGSSQFFLCLAPQPGLDGRHTVFGRVIEGLDAMSNLEITATEGENGKEEPIAEAVPSIIYSAKVIRKREHEYKPKKVSANDAFGSRREVADLKPTVSVLLTAAASTPLGRDFRDPDLLF